MVKRTSHLLLAFVLAWTWSTAAEPNGSVTTTVATVIDHRDRALNDELGGAVTLEVKLAGQVLDGATTYENVRMDRAADDVGSDLSPQGDFVKLNERLQLVGEHPRKQGEPPYVLIDFMLNRSARTAKKITLIEGRVDIRVGRLRKKIVVGNVPALIGAPINDAQLAAAGLKVTLAAPDQMDISFQIEGNIAWIDSVDMIDADGTVLAHRRPPVAFYGIRRTDSGLKLPRPLDAKMSLQFTLAPDQKKVTVPFELKAVPLP